MAVDTGRNTRKGAVRKRSQRKTKMMGQKRWTKRSRTSGEFMSQKKPSARKETTQGASNKKVIRRSLDALPCRGRGCLRSGRRNERSESPRSPEASRAVGWHCSNRPPGFAGKPFVRWRIARNVVYTQVLRDHTGSG